MLQNPSSQTAKAAAAAFDQLLAVAQLQEVARPSANSDPGGSGLLRDIACRLLALGEPPRGMTGGSAYTWHETKHSDYFLPQERVNCF